VGAHIFSSSADLRGKPRGQTRKELPMLVRFLDLAALLSSGVIGALAITPAVESLRVAVRRVRLRDGR
jgi:hypothetical protein